MRALFLLAVVAILAGCGESPSSPPPQRPESVRKCGELQGVEPVEPVIIGSYPLPEWAEEPGSCPMFAPVPCTGPILPYLVLCGKLCVPMTATAADGDTWLVGCAMRGPPTCGGPDRNEDYCVVSPLDGKTYWIHIDECDPVFFPMWLCWAPCGEEREEPPAEWCP